MRSVDGRALDRCSNCGLVFLNPQPRASVIASWYGEGYFTTDTDVALGVQHREFAEAGMLHGTETFFQLSRRRRLRGLRVLEVGCGGGAFMSQCAKAGAIITGLEISEFAAERLRSTYGFDVHQGTVESNRFPDRSFNVVAFTDVLEHVQSPRNFLT